MLCDGQNVNRLVNELVYCTIGLFSEERVIHSNKFNIIKQTKLLQIFIYKENEMQ